MTNASFFYHRNSQISRSIPRPGKNYIISIWSAKNLKNELLGKKLFRHLYLEEIIVIYEFSEVEGSTEGIAV